jgi:hypothetical protein
MADTQEIPWKRIAVEASAIVASILLAFAIDAWWSARQLHLDEQHILRQLDAEFETNANLLAVRRRDHVVILESIELVLSLTGPAIEKAAAESPEVRAAVDRMTRWWTYDPQMGVLSGLTQSGRLSIISSDSLRNALASWPSRVRDLVEDEVFAQQMTANQMDPYLNETVSMRNVVPHASVGGGRFPADLTGLLTDQKFENLVHLKLGLTLQVLDEYDGLATEISEIQALILKASEAG